MKAVWIIGRGGLLGSALAAVAQGGDRVSFVPDIRFSWDDADVLAEQLRAAVADFAALAAPVGRWEILWAAGIGTLGSAEHEAGAEYRNLAALLDALDRQPTLLRQPRAIAFASSAGAVYGGSADAVINEDSPVAATTPYGRIKLAQEALLDAFAQRTGTSVLITRLSTLYGAGQSERKAQGLLTHIARSLLLHQPIQIYVPLDTIRDYLAVEDAAGTIVRTLATGDEAGRCRVRIVASERPVTIAEILALYRRIARRTPRYTTSLSRRTAAYSSRLQFRSLHARDAANPPMPLALGIGRLWQKELERYVRASHRP